MLRPLSKGFLFLMLILLFSSSCTQRRGAAVEGINAGIRFERFDQELFGLRQDSIQSAIDGFYQEYGDFFDVFNTQLIRIGPASSRLYPSYLSMFINDPLNREVYEHTQQVFGSVDEQEEKMDLAFRHYLYHYPDSVAPRVIAYVSRFNEGLMTVSSFVGVGLDQYLGADCPYYGELGLPAYILPKKAPERIPFDVVLAWASSIYPFQAERDNLLSRMIWQGQLAWFTATMFPEEGDEQIMCFNEDQMRWCRKNEKQMWTYLVEEKLLFSGDPMVIRKLIEDAPHTSYFTPESPGRAVVWQGMRIVEEYARRNPDLGPAGIMSISDPQEILKGSRYDP